MQNDYQLSVKNSKREGANQTAKGREFQSQGVTIENALFLVATSWASIGGGIL